MDDGLFPDASSLWKHIPSIVETVVASWKTMLLVAARLTGGLFVGPLMGSTVLTWRIRLGMVVYLTLVVSPLLLMKPSDGVLLVSHASHEARREHPIDTTAAPREGRIGTDLVLSMAFNIGIGAALGMSVLLFLTGVRLGGDFFDRHSGLGMGSILNPESSWNMTSAGEMISWLAIVLLLVIQPFNGDLHLIRMLLDNFHDIPVDASSIPINVLELPNKIFQQSLLLGLRIAMPFTVMMMLVDMTLNFTQRSSRWQLSSCAYTLRSTIALFVLAATFPGIQESIRITLDESMSLVTETLRGSANP